MDTIRASGGNFETWEADLSDPSIIPQLFDHAEEAFGSVDILINNAAHCDPDTFIPQSELSSDSRALDKYPLSTLTAEKHDKLFAWIAYFGLALIGYVAVSMIWSGCIEVATATGM